MLVRQFLSIVNDRKALIGLCLLVKSQWGPIRDSWDSQVLTIAHIAIGLSLQVHSLASIHLCLCSYRLSYLNAGRDEFLAEPLDVTDAVLIRLDAVLLLLNRPERKITVVWLNASNIWASLVLSTRMQRNNNLAFRSHKIKWLDVLNYSIRIHLVANDFNEVKWISVEKPCI